MGTDIGLECGVDAMCSCPTALVRASLRRMYTVFIAVPFFRTAPGSVLVSGEWGKSLLLLRDSLEGRYGDLVVAAPEAKRREDLKLAQEPLELVADRDQVRFETIGDPTWRLRSFWKNYSYIKRRCREIAGQSQVVHAGMNDVFKPYALTGFHAGMDAGCVGVFVIDTDIVLQMEQLAKSMKPHQKLKSWFYRRRYQRAAERAVGRADLALLKGAAVQARYARFANRAEDFYDVSYGDADIIAPQRVAQKIASLNETRPLRLVSFGRLIPRKGVDHTLRAFAKAVGRGADLTLDIIGGGPEADRLKEMVSELELHDRINLTGPVAYDQAFLERLQSYDAFVFTPLGEDTPRAIFDALASGLGIVGYDIPFVKQVCQQAKQLPPTSLGNVDALTQTLIRLGQDRQAIVPLIQNAVSFARNNSAEQWYRRRAQWTHEVVDQKRLRENG